MNALLAPVRAFLSSAFLWTCFVVGLAASAAAGTVLDGTPQNIATGAGAVLALLAGSRIARRPRIRAFLSRPGTLWFLFLFNGATAAVMYLTTDGVKGVLGAAMMALVSLGAAGGLVTGRRGATRVEAAGAEAVQAAGGSR